MSRMSRRRRIPRVQGPLHGQRRCQLQAGQYQPGGRQQPGLRKLRKLTAGQYQPGRQQPGLRKLRKLTDMCC